MAKINIPQQKLRLKSINSMKSISFSLKSISSVKSFQMQKIALDYKNTFDIFSNINFSFKQDVDHKLDNQIVIAKFSDFGMCGSYNNELRNEVKKFNSDKNFFLLLGKKAPMLKRNIFTSLDNTKDVVKIINLIIKTINDNNIERVVFIYMDKKGVQKICLDKTIITSENTNELDFEGDRDKFLNTFFAKEITIFLNYTFFVSEMVEHEKRIILLDAAVKNSDELIQKINIAIAKERQEIITSEILELNSSRTN